MTTTMMTVADAKICPTCGGPKRISEDTCRWESCEYPERSVVDAHKVELQKAEQMAAKYLHLGNLASERGEKELAERHYVRSQWWHDRMNQLLGNN